MEQLAEDTGTVPPSLLNRPTLHTFDTEVWNAFAKLSARRSVSGFGAISAISYQEIQSYLDLVLFLDDPDDRTVFIQLIEHLDAMFLKEYAEKQKLEQQKNNAKRSGRSRPQIS